ncbi:CLUMA_CG007704, isoform A [Clunio marinus]|uniref:CLUMA_CG007704, isoform A n=1 Tax=Clunio marinus TaxID=568069 RepID=A0A1J1I3L7_9DIPT|nr:CLUMA_CG007704, isoform A [Clunio marinus]
MFTVHLFFLVVNTLDFALMSFRPFKKCNYFENIEFKNMILIICFHSRLFSREQLTTFGKHINEEFHLFKIQLFENWPKMNYLNVEKIWIFLMLPTTLCVAPNKSRRVKTDEILTPVVMEAGKKGQRLN